MKDIERKYSTSDKIAFWSFGFATLYLMAQLLRGLF
jgi:hypothetical protein